VYLIIASSIFEGMTYSSFQFVSVRFIVKKNSQKAMFRLTLKVYRVLFFMKAISGCRYR